jgi:predicted O-methyltransferase YrrM
MTTVLEQILSTQSVSDGRQTLPLRHPDFPDLPVHVDEREGAFLQSIIRQVQPETSLEIGFAYGISTLYICEELSRMNRPVRHIVTDPFQTTQWRGIGLRNVLQAGFEPIVDFREERSEQLLPRLLADNTTLDFALIDGWHTFDQVMVEFYYLNRMLRVGGVLVFDDADRRSVNRVIRHALTYPAYRVYGAEAVPARAISAAGRLRRAVGSLPGASTVLRADFIHRDWDLGVLGSCVAIEKIRDDKRSSGWDAAF